MIKRTTSNRVAAGEELERMGSWKRTNGVRGNGAEVGVLTEAEEGKEGMVMGKREEVEVMKEG